MMNRFAELLYWAGRYVERAGNHARLIDINYHMRHELYGQREREYVWERLVESTGGVARFEELYSNINAGTNELTVIHFLTFERSNINSIFNCVQQARNNIRTLRQLVPAELWEVINAFYLWLKDQNVSQVMLQAPHLFYQRVREWATLFSGTVDAAMVREQEWDFIQTGKFVERVDNTLRIVNSVHQQIRRESDSESEHYNRTAALLKSVGGFEAFRRQYAVNITFDNALAFMLQSSSFPHSVQYSLDALVSHINQIGLPNRDFEALDERVSDMVDAMKSIVGPIRSGHARLETAALEHLVYLSNQLGCAVSAAFFQNMYVGA